MAESSRHRQLKNRDAHGTGKTEAVLASGIRLDALSPAKIATEVERSGSAGIKKSVNSCIARKARLRVPNSNLDAAYQEMRRQRLGG